MLLRVVTSVQRFCCPQDLEVASGKTQELQILSDDSHTQQLLIQREWKGTGPESGVGLTEPGIKPRARCIVQGQVQAQEPGA